MLLLNTAPVDRADLSSLFSISETQLSYITNAAPGSGLVRVGSILVPFANDFDTSTQLYKLMSTKPGEA